MRSGSFFSSPTMSSFFRSAEKKRFFSRPGNLLILFFSGLNLLLWFAIQPGNPILPGHTSRLIGEALGATSLVIMACIVVLAARPKVLEPLFGGLDRMYFSHANYALAVLLLLNLHSMLVSGPIEKESIAKSLGGLALDIMLLASLWALAPRLRQWMQNIDQHLFNHFKGSYSQLKRFMVWKKLASLVDKGWLWLCSRYDVWRLTHKIMAVVLLLGITHIVLVDSLMKKSPVLTGYVVIWMVIAAIAVFTE